jgi:hypothetical protein
METTINVGDRVGYACVPSLMQYKGMVRALGPTPRGGDCTVEWLTPNHVTSEECLSTLRKLGKN